jgi:hypothetical protein
MEVPALVRIWALVSALVSRAKSASRMSDSLAVRFSIAAWSDRTLVWRTFFSSAPRRPRVVEISSMADSRMRLALAKLRDRRSLAPPDFSDARV